MRFCENRALWANVGWHAGPPLPLRRPEEARSADDGRSSGNGGPACQPTFAHCSQRPVFTESHFTQPKQSNLLSQNEFIQPTETPLCLWYDVFVPDFQITLEYSCFLKLYSSASTIILKTHPLHRYFVLKGHNVINFYVFIDVLWGLDDSNSGIFCSWYFFFFVYYSQKLSFFRKILNIACNGA